MEQAFKISVAILMFIMVMTPVVMGLIKTRKDLLDMEKRDAAKRRK